MKTKSLYTKSQPSSEDPSRSFATQREKQIIYSTDVRDFGQVAKSVPCQKACPAETNIPGYIRCIFEKRYGRAYELNRSYNILPGVLGRICSRPCEDACRHGDPDESVSVGICHLKRSSADLKSPMHRIIESLYTPSGKSVAIVGSGPAGLAAAHELTVLGHKAVIFESMEKPGGMLMYGIPEFRLPRRLLMDEINNILRLGVDLRTGVKIGRDMTLLELATDFNAVVVAAGCTLPRKLDIEGEDLDGVYNGLDFMERFNAAASPKVGDAVLVIGAGYTAVDCARAAVRLGATDVSINMRKTIEYMRIDEHEKHEADFEKIRINSLIQPTRILGEDGRVTGVEFIRTKMKYMDKPPYRSSVAIEGSEFTVPADCVIAALGQVPDAPALSEQLTGGGFDGFRTPLDRIFAAGDFVTGSSDVISAIAGGRRCAQAVDMVVTGSKRKQRVVRLEPAESTDRPRAYDFITRVPMNTLGIEDRLAHYAAEVETGFTEDQAIEESKRCFLCNLKYEIDPKACIYCSACIDVAPKDCIKMIAGVDVSGDGSLGEYQQTSEWNEVVSIAIDNARCIRCGQCVAVCPMDCISVTKTELIEIDTDDWQ